MKISDKSIVEEIRNMKNNYLPSRKQPVQNIFFDIETLPSDEKNVQEQIFMDIRPPGNITKKESIEKWLDENREAEYEKKLRRTALQPAYGRICAISYAVEDEDPVVLLAQEEMDEAGIIIEFFNVINDLGSAPSFTGYNIRKFDIPFLTMRACALGISFPPTGFFPRMQGNDLYNMTTDLMNIFSPDIRNAVSMNRISEVLNVEYRKTADGSMIFDMWNEGKKDKITEYCRSDILVTRAIFVKLEDCGYW